LDYTLYWPGLRAVDSTAAVDDNSFLQAVDATDRWK
jgi:hypothetical protein